MCVLSDKHIKLAMGKEIMIDPYDESCVQPSSVDLKLHNTFRLFHGHGISVLDTQMPPPEDFTSLVEIEENKPFVIHPNSFVLGSTLEKITLSNDMVARLDGRSSFGRLGLLIHVTAGYVDPGFSGHLTLEMLNVSGVPIILWPGTRIAQISFLILSSKSEKMYEGKYQNQSKPNASKIYEDFRTND